LIVQPRPSAPRDPLASILGRALDEARRASAVHAEARIHLRKYEHVKTREDHVVTASSAESYGLAVRVLAFGAWGFASSPDVTDESAREVVARAVAVARANRGAQKRAVALCAVSPVLDAWQTPFTVDPFQVPLSEKAEMLLEIWSEVRKVSQAAFLEGAAHAFDEWKLVATSDGSLLEQRLVRVGAGYSVTAKNDKTGEIATRAHELPPMQAGWEYITGSTLVSDARQIAEQAAMKLEAPEIQEGKRDLLLAPSNLWLVIHESVGHATEVDRMFGYETDVAGTTFVGQRDLGNLRFGSDLVTVVADKTTPGGLATCAYDDEGVKTQRWLLVDEGKLVGCQTTREQARWLGESQSRGTAYAENHECPPLQRMPNVSLAPQPRSRSLEDLVAATDDGVMVTGVGSWSIDQQRHNFQFGGQMFYEIRGGRIRHALKNAVYQSNTLEFWRSCDEVGGPDGWELHGTLFDGKGDPGQSNPVSHGCPPARFRQVTVLRASSGSRP
jgi:TldD protein